MNRLRRRFLTILNLCNREQRLALPRHSVSGVPHVGVFRGTASGGPNHVASGQADEGRRRIRFKSHHGLEATEICREAGSGEGGTAVLPSIGLRLPAGAATDLRSIVAGSLGMKLVALLTSQLSGRLSAGANPAGRGACFVVTLPAS